MELYNDPSKLSVMSKNSVERSRLFDKNMYLNEFENVINQMCIRDRITKEKDCCFCR